MRSVFAYVRDATVDDVAAFLEHTCPLQPGPPWVWESRGDACVYIRCEPGVPADVDQEAQESVRSALGSSPTATVSADVSGRHPGDVEVRALLSALLRSFRGVAQDDYTSHAWTLDEVLSGHKVQGHGFFDYQGWSVAARAKVTGDRGQDRGGFGHE